jgi:hypothetical protein
MSLPTAIWSPDKIPHHPKPDYGEAENIVGEATAGRRGDFFQGGGTGTRNAGRCHHGLRASLSLCALSRLAQSGRRPAPVRSPWRAPLTRCLGAGWRGRAMPCRRACRACDPVPTARDVSRRLQHAVDRLDSDLELFMRRFPFSRKPTASKLTDGLMSRLPPQS